MTKIRKSRKLAIDVLDEFEELLATHNVKIPDSNREGEKYEACLYGGAYYALEDKLVELIEDAWIGKAD